MHLLRTMAARGYKPAGYDLGDPVSYLILDDYDLLHSIPSDPDLNILVSKIKGRVLPMRALVISLPCFESKDRESRENFDKLFGREGEEQIRALEKELAAELRLRDGDVVFDFPDLPRLDGTGQAIVQLGRGDQHNVVLQNIYPAGAWAKAYAGYRKVAYVFTTARDRRGVGRAAIAKMKTVTILARSLARLVKAPRFGMPQSGA
jgi:hypothetical protein